MLANQQKRPRATCAVNDLISLAFRTCLPHLAQASLTALDFFDTLLFFFCRDNHSAKRCTGIPKNMITIHFDSSNLVIWAPQICCAVNLLSVRYLFNKPEINYTNLNKRIEVSKALAVITTNITPAIDKVICLLKKHGFNPKAAVATCQTPSGTQCQLQLSTR
jgi:hypothetical protein